MPSCSKGGAHVCAQQKPSVKQCRLGYTRVRVMPGGIFGWISAGKPVERAKLASGSNEREND